MLHAGLAKRTQDRPPTALALAEALRGVAAAHRLPVPSSRVGQDVDGSGAEPDDTVVVKPSTASDQGPARYAGGHGAPPPIPASAPPSAPARSPRTGLVVSVAVVAVALLLAAGGVWALLRDPPPDTPVSTPAPTGTGIAVSDPPTSEAPAESPLDLPATPPTDQATAADSALSLDDLATVLLTAADLPSDASLLDTIRAEDPQDPDHPLLDLAYCDQDPPLQGVAGAAADVYRLSSGPVDLALSSAIATDSDARAQDVVSQVLASAATCDSYTTPNGTVEPGAASDLGDGAVRLDVEVIVLGQRFPSAVYLATAGPLVLVVEVSAPIDRATADGLLVTLRDRAARLLADQ